MRMSTNLYVLAWLINCGTEDNYSLQAYFDNTVLCFISAQTAVHEKVGQSALTMHIALNVHLQPLRMHTKQNYFWVFFSDGENSSEVLNDIDSMLQGLTDELDAMLEIT